MSRPGKVLRVASELNHMLHRLARAPVNSFEFLTLRPYSPGGLLNALAPEATPQGHNLQVDIVYGVDYQGI